MVRVTLDKQANVKMMDTTNYRPYRSGQSHHYYDDLAKVSLFDMRPPYYGRWHVTVDLGGYGAAP